MNSGAKEWVEFAERDYEASLLLAKSHNPPFEIIGYHCQQTAEKYLKALLIENNQPVLFIHDLGKLNTECRKLLPYLSIIQGICERLTPFGTVTRYPGSSMKVGAEHLPLVLTWTQKIRDVVRKQLKLT